MTARCVECSNMKSFANTRGAKLSERRCNCGGKLEITYSAEILDMEHPLDPSKTRSWKGQKYFGVVWSKTGLFLYDRENLKYIKLEGEFVPADIEHPKERKFKPVKTSKEWAKLGKVALEDFDKTANVIIMDPDGWDRKDLDKSYNELITADEFMKRICVSTIQCANPVITTMNTVAELICIAPSIIDKM